MEQCDRYLELISVRLDGPLTQAEERELEAHLAGCPACRALESQLAAIHTAFPPLEEVPAPEGFAQGVMDRIRAQEQAAPKVVPLFRRPQIKALARLAACAVLCVGLYQGGVFLSGKDTPNAVTGGEAPMAVQNDAADAAGGVSAQSQSAAEDLPASKTKTAEEPAQSQTLMALPELNAALAGASVESREYEVERQAAAAVLTLSQLPQGAEAVLGAELQWSEDENGRQSCLVTGEQIEALTALAEEQGLPLTASGPSVPGEPCTLVLEPSE